MSSSSTGGTVDPNKWDNDPGDEEPVDEAILFKDALFRLVVFILYVVASLVAFVVFTCLSDGLAPRTLYYPR